MKQVHLVVGVLTIVLSGAAGVYGAWCWWRVSNSRLVLAAAARLAGGDRGRGGARGRARADRPQVPGLHTLYGVLPLFVSFVAEQLRVSTAQMVLDKRGFESAQEVGELPDDEQQAIVATIMQREIGVMALAALVNTVLLARAAMT